MALEIERKFLVANDDFKVLAVRKIEMKQFYLSADVERTVRVRIAGEVAKITIKGKTHGCVRSEWEYDIPRADALQMQALRVGRVVEKTRYIVAAGDGLRWEIDVFGGELRGLTVAEIELPAENTVFDKPGFIGREVTGDPQYYNSSLALSPALPSVL